MSTLPILLEQKRSQENSISGAELGVQKRLLSLSQKLESHLNSPCAQSQQIRNLSDIVCQVEKQLSLLGQSNQAAIDGVASAVRQLGRQLASLGQIQESNIRGASLAVAQLEGQLASLGRIHQVSLDEVSAGLDQLTLQISNVGQASQTGLLQLSQKIGPVLLGSATTEDDAATTILSIPILDLSAHRFEVGILGYKSDGSQVGSYKIVLAAKRSGAVVSILNATKTVEYEDDAAWDVGAAVDDLMIDVNVTGALATTVDWVARCSCMLSWVATS